MSLLLQFPHPISLSKTSSLPPFHPLSTPKQSILSFCSTQSNSLSLRFIPTQKNVRGCPAPFVIILLSSLKPFNGCALFHLRISTCQYASTSTISSVLNTTNPNGAKLFGSEPSGPTNAASVSLNFTILYAFACHLMLMITVNHF